MSAREWQPGDRAYIEVEVLEGGWVSVPPPASGVKFFIGTAVDVLSEHAGWSKIAVDGLTGWMYGAYLKRLAQQAETPDLAARLDSLEARMSAIENRLIIIEGDMRRFYQILGEHTGKISMLERKQA